MLGALGAFDNPLNGSPGEGVFIWTPFASEPPTMVAGAGAFVAAQGGTIMGRFGWADPAANTVANARTSAAQLLGLVLPQCGKGWTWVYSDAGRWFIRQGLPVTLATGGNFWLRFAGGAYIGERVYADLLDGHAISGEAVGAEPTPWLVCSNAIPGGLAKASPYAFFGA